MKKRHHMNSIYKFIKEIIYLDFSEEKLQYYHAFLNEPNWVWTFVFPFQQQYFSFLFCVSCFYISFDAWQILNFVVAIFIYKQHYDVSHFFRRKWSLNKIWNDKKWIVFYAVQYLIFEYSSRIKKLRYTYLWFLV